MYFINDLYFILFMLLIFLVMGLYILISVMDSKIKKLIEKIEKSRNYSYPNQNYDYDYNRRN